MMRRLQRLATLLAAPALAALGGVRGWWGRGVTPGYFLVAGDYPGFLARGDATAFCQYHAKGFCQGRGVDVGAGRRAFPGARPIEDRADENAYRLAEADGALDYVFSSHCLEHLERWAEALMEWRRVLKPGGILYLYLPHPACRMWRSSVLPHHVWQPEPDGLAAHLRSIGFEIVESSLFPDAYLSFYIVARRIQPPP
jgi:SAM-dependent methyltransferase